MMLRSDSHCPSTCHRLESASFTNLQVAGTHPHAGSTLAATTTPRDHREPDSRTTHLHELGAFANPTTWTAACARGPLLALAATRGTLSRTPSTPPRPITAFTSPAPATDKCPPRQPPKKKLRAHPLSLMPSSQPAAAPSTRPHQLMMQTSVPKPQLTPLANYDVDAFVRLAQGARSGISTRPPLTDGTIATDRRVQAQAVRRMRERAVERAAVVQWLVHLNAVHTAFRFAPETIYMGVQYMDRALAASPTARKHLAPRKPHLHLLALVCLTLAAKFAEEYAAPSVASVLAALSAVPPPPASTATAVAAAMIAPLAPVWTHKHVLAMERKVLEALRFDLAVVAPSAAVFELLFANVDLAAELCELVVTGGQSAQHKIMHQSPSVSPNKSNAAACLSSASSPLSQGSVEASMSASASPPASSCATGVLVPPSPVSPTFGHDMFFSSNDVAHVQKQHHALPANASSFAMAAAARPFPPPIAPSSKPTLPPGRTASWCTGTQPKPPDHHPPAHSPMDVDSPPSSTARSVDDHHMCMMTPPQTPPRTSTAAASDPGVSRDERWPAALSSPAHRNVIARVVRAVQTELVQRVLVHAQGTAHAPLNTAVVLLNRAIVCLATANAVNARPMGGRATGLDPSPMATPAATGTVTVSVSGAAIAQATGIVSRVACLARDGRDRAAFSACVEMVKQAVGGQVVGATAIASAV